MVRGKWWQVAAPSIKWSINWQSIVQSSPWLRCRAATGAFCPKKMMSLALLAMSFAVYYVYQYLMQISVENQ